MAPIAPLPPSDLRLKLTRPSAVEELQTLRPDPHKSLCVPRGAGSGAKVAGPFCRTIAICHHTLP
jgi:hypothetical protein